MCKLHYLLIVFMQSIGVREPEKMSASKAGLSQVTDFNT
ncbi:Uncharacterised protein [Yersinia frederiksenii]|uniref:Uncharacterized protein n=2 Tax=Yersinia frederiksenii TaxID=29484 RepID=A0A380PZ61_YERFR|nr:hypothetical protein DJ58_1782 [Yersinia frederiksenii ATCC 33641]CFR12807.1 Uncharacterised protein [Yersinia frederiksenii]CNB99226.1 Uncharacterised protein [Yersinia frederiksenii]CNG23031.1 Uncharacterised protein [Yersinia frederiksenii]SUP78870.1 Uncharacterised protein [Yersinia frederiksenii]